MRRNSFQDAMQQTRFDWTVVWDSFVVLAVKLSSDTNVRSLLSRYHIAKHTQCANQFLPSYGTRQFHRARTSSRTK
ncbi:MAG: hypothetical protein JWQ04_2507 [Pedosphaera sp.]|nr:hypothetical protein [Pedosphaera sp.]